MSVAATEARPVDASPGRIGRVLTAASTSFVARALLTAPYWTSGVAKLADGRSAVAEVRALGLPAAPAVAGAVIAVQLLGSAAVIRGRGAGLGAGALAVFTGVATLLAHRFWTSPPGTRARQFATFTEHVGLIGGLLLAAVLSQGGPGRS